MYSNAILKLVPCKNKAVCILKGILKSCHMEGIQTRILLCRIIYPTDWMLTYSTFFFPGGCLELHV